MLFKLSSVHK